MARIYLASSWRNPYQPKVLELLRDWGNSVYDFRFDARKIDDPDVSAGELILGVDVPPATAFSWSEIDPAWEGWTPMKYRQLLQTHARAAQGYVGDLRGMEWADTCVLLLPCGNSAHIEAGYMKGRGKRLIIYWHGNKRVVTARNETTGAVKEWTFEPDLMYLLADNLCIGEKELQDCLRGWSSNDTPD